MMTLEIPVLSSILASSSQEATVPYPKLDNLDRWIKSGQADRWVGEHSGEWNDSEWAVLLEELKAGPYWPMSPDDVGLHLELLSKQYRKERERILRGSETSPIERALWWYAAGLAIVGLASGFFAGASHTPIVGTLLPLLFALIGGGSGVYVANADLTAPSIAMRLQWLGRALGLFGIACLVGSGAGISLRLHHEVPPDRNALLTVWHGNTHDGVELAALRAKLRMLGASSAEEDFVLRAAARTINDAARPIPPEHVRELVAETRQLKTDLKQLRDKSATSGTPVPEDADNLVTALDLFDHQTEPWVQSGMPRDLYKNAVESVWYHMGRIAFPVQPATAVWVHQTGFDTQNLYKLYASLHAEFELRDDLDWELGGPMADKLDKFLQWANKSAKPLPNTDEVLPAIDMNAPSDQSKDGKKTGAKTP